jgi:hypothetical protein
MHDGVSNDEKTPTDANSIAPDMRTAEERAKHADHITDHVWCALEDFWAKYGMVCHQRQSFDHFVKSLLPHIISENSDVTTMTSDGMPRRRGTSQPPSALSLRLRRPPRRRTPTVCGCRTWPCRHSELPHPVYQPVLAPTDREGERRVRAAHQAARRASSRPELHIELRGKLLLHQPRVA